MQQGNLQLYDITYNLNSEFRFSKSTKFPIALQEKTTEYAIILSDI